jgi:hemoglobin
MFLQLVFSTRIRGEVVMRRIYSAMMCVLAAGLLAACSSMDAQRPAEKSQASLYERLGGLGAIKVVVDDFVGFVAADTRINRYFAKTDVPKLKQHLVDQVCQGTGGPCKYQGRDMVATHKGMNINDAEFAALVEDLVKALDKNKVPEKEKGELLGILGPMKPAIVGQ